MLSLDVIDESKELVMQHHLMYECASESRKIYGYVALHMVNSHVSSYIILQEVVCETFSCVRNNVTRQLLNVKG